MLSLDEDVSRITCVGVTTVFLTGLTGFMADLEAADIPDAAARRSSSSSLSKSWNISEVTLLTPPLSLHLLLAITLLLPLPLRRHRHRDSEFLLLFFNVVLISYEVKNNKL